MEVLKLKKRNSDFGDIFLVMAIIFGVAIFIIILAYAYSQIEPRLNTGLTASTPAEADSNVTLTLSKTSTALTRINILFPLLIAGLFGFVLISAMFLRSHPAFFFIGLMILGAALILGAIYSNVFQELTETDEFDTTTDDFNIMELFMENLPVIIMIFFVAMAVIMWTRAGGTARGGAY